MVSQQGDQGDPLQGLQRTELIRNQGQEALQQQHSHLLLRKQQRTALHWKVGKQTQLPQRIRQRTC